MKRKFLIFLMVVLTGLLFVLAVGCSPFGSESNKGDGNGDPTSPEAHYPLEELNEIKLDLINSMVYVPDCSKSSMYFYQIELTRGNDTRTIGSINARNLTPEDGYFAIEINDFSVSSSFFLTVICKERADSKKYAQKKFTYEMGPGFIYDSEHCTFNRNTGLFSWAAVDGATCYKVKLISGRDSAITSVVDTQIVLEESIDSLFITPIFDGYVCAPTPDQIYVSGPQQTATYDYEKQAFTWPRIGDSYFVEIVEGENTFTETVTDGEVPFVPSYTADVVTIKITTDNPLRRIGTGETTFKILPRVTDISIDPITCELTWEPVENVTRYDVYFSYDDGTHSVYTFTTETSYTPSLTKAGSVTLRIETVGEGDYIASETRFPVEVLGRVYAISPTMSYDEENGKLVVSIPSDKSNVDAYTVTLSADGAQPQTVEAPCATTDTTSLELVLPANRLSDITISRTFKGSDKYYCFYNRYSRPEDYSGQVLYIGTPDVTMKSKNSVSSPYVFTVKVNFPEELRGKGSFTLFHGYYKTAGTQTVSDDVSYTYTVSEVYTRRLTIAYTAFTPRSGGNITVLTRPFRKDIVMLSAVDITADSEKITWESVDGADGYRVLRKDGDEYTELMSGEEREYPHGVTNTGAYSYYVVATSRDPFVLNSVADMCTVRKLEAPTVSVTASGELEISQTNASASIVTLLDGTVTEASVANLRAVMSTKPNAALTAYCVGENTKKSVMIDSDDVSVTLHRIADIDETSMGFAVDAQMNTVSFAPVANADTFVHVLSRKERADTEYAIVREYTDDTTLLDGDELSEGMYELAVKPVGYCVETDVYLYLGDFAAATFHKDGIHEVTVSADGVGFDIDGIVYTDGGYDVGWKITLRTTYDPSNPPVFTFELGECAYLYGNTAMTKLLGNTAVSSDGYNFVFEVDYRGATDEQLSANRTLKGSEYKIVVTRAHSEKPTFKGVYSFLNRTDNDYRYDTIKVKLTPSAGEVLRDFEDYELIYRKLDYTTNVYTTILETKGTEIVIDNFSGNPNSANFYLRVASDKFVVEDGKVKYYFSASSVDSYTVAVQNKFDVRVDVDEVGYSTERLSPDELYVKFTVTMMDVEFSDRYDLQYCDDTGTWVPWVTNRQISTAGIIFESFMLNGTQKNLIVSDGKVVKLRLRHCGARKTFNYTEIMFDDSDWTYLNVPVQLPTT